MLSIDDKDWIKTYLWGEISWINMELFEHDGKIWTNNTVDDKLNENASCRALFVFDPILYASKRLKPNIDLLDPSCPLVDEYRKQQDDPSMDLLLGLWTFVLSKDDPKSDMVVRPKNQVPPEVSFRFVEQWMERNPEKTDEFLKELKVKISC